MIILLGYCIETDLQSVIVKYPDNQPWQVHHQKKEYILSTDLSTPNGRKRSNSNYRQQKPA
jgi:hypothetical protein